MKDWLSAETTGVCKMPDTENHIMAGLVFTEEKRIDLLDMATRTVKTLSGLCQDVRSLGLLTETVAGIETAHCRISLTLSRNVLLPGLARPASVVLRIDVQGLEHASPDTGPAIDAVLARVAIELSDHLRPPHLQWVEQEALLSAADVTMACELAAHDTPANDTQKDQALRARAALTRVEDLHTKLDERLARMPPPAVHFLPSKVLIDVSEGIIEDTPEMIAPSIENIAEETDRLRLSAWFLTFAVACFALPVGLTLVIINLVKGENLRLAGQAAALSGLFVSLQTSGATAAAAQVVQTVLH
ncbi:MULTISPECIES: hypothetical protein [unclassified Roseovarius]|uniref:hypothetical protein n=1 Tax=unclassified Roseovarius TaxID=2614913 RepID=UPI00273D98CD|nr:hypothetical protein [Roseovarius sp. MMSF_3350]